MSFLDKIFGDPNEKTLKELRVVVDEINKLEPGFAKLEDEKFKVESDKFREELRGLEGEELNKKLDEILPRAFAVAREAAKRVLGQRHYDVQLIGGMVLHQGRIGEMKTGEGKTLVATLPLYLNALAGKGAHLITVNDYLAQIGAGWMAPVYHFLGLSTGVIIHETGLLYDPEYTDDSQYDARLKHFRHVERAQAYQADITYGTNNEFGFDYLRDNMVQNLEQMAQRGLHYAIVDEIDSILIDEARTPLIISAPAEESTDKYIQFAQLVRRLKENESPVSQSDSKLINLGKTDQEEIDNGDYNVDEKMKAATLTESGIQKMEKWLGVDNIYTERGIREVHHIEQALKAHALFKLDRDYVVKNNEVIIVDEFTGRLMHGRRYSEGLHQAIEAKEGVAVQRESQTLATITFQNYFRMYEKLSGMTGTAITEAEEFAKIYNLETVIVPTHRKLIRKDNNDLIYMTEKGKYKAVIEEVKKRSLDGQPVLVGTISIQKNEMLLNMMERAGLNTQVLNAKNHLKEARIISDAGKPGAITIATNMAGRGVDIMLGGNEPSKDSPEHKEWEKEHEKVIASGGLFMIGTERHEARRIDNQLRGRAGRQGDAGESRFYVSMDDDLMRIFGGDRMKSIMTTLKVPEDMPIENKFISRSIETAQTKVEGNNFDIRKHLVEYDDVINKHREAIYGKRRKILEIAKKTTDNRQQTTDNSTVILGSEATKDLDEKAMSETRRDSSPTAQNDKKSLSDLILKDVENEIEQVVSFHTAADMAKDWNLEEIYQVCSTIFPVNEKLKTDLSEFSRNDNHKLDKAMARTAIIKHLNSLAKKKYKEIKDKAKEMDVNWLELEKAVLLRSIDTLWIEHLEAMASVRQGIGLRGYGQRDPLVEYKKEAYRLYNELQSFIQKEVVYSIFKVGAIQTAGPRMFNAPSISDRAQNFSAPAKVMNSQTASFAGFNQAANASPMAKEAANRDEAGDKIPEKPKDAEGQKIGRNDPCPCGSGKKYKKCCGK
ncbi:preprotein translocase subunit SecA [Candidatus Parcubacteria bacterium]|nr:preprotein translocase subunit SecA [Candidatus Parcubacteria bacterium]